MARVAVVTGGTRGIGEAISVALRDAGVTVAANYAGNEEKARGFSDRTGIAAHKWDVSDFEACIAGVQRVESELGPVDILVNNAGITRDGTMKRMSRQAWDEVIDVNLGGCFNMAKAVWEGMNARKYGRVVNIGSINGQAGQYGQVNYAAAKSGIHGFTKALAQEGARAGITVNAISTPRWSPRCHPTCSKRSSRKFRSAGSAAPTRSLAASPFSVPRRAVSSPARRFRSTAASICTEDWGTARKWDRSSDRS
jgi:acetoacetyl-CoA reductase